MNTPYLIRVDRFFRSHWIGIVLVAVATGVLGNFVYDYVKPKSLSATPLIGMAGPDSGIDRYLIGTWKGTTTSKSSAGELIAEGLMQLLETGQYNYTGEVEIRAPSGITLRYSAAAAGSWKTVGDRFVIVASTIKSIPRVLKQPGKPDIDLTNLHKALPHSLPHIEDVTPNGASQEYVIIDLSNGHLRAKSHDLRGTPVLYEAVRQ